MAQTLHSKKTIHGICNHLGKIHCGLTLSLSLNFLQIFSQQFRHPQEHFHLHILQMQS